MVKRIAVVGCREYIDYEEAKNFIDACLEEINQGDELIFISGNCRGADKLGEKYAMLNGYKIEYFPAEWHKYGKGAGPKRNKQIAQNSDYVISFWDGKSKGTKSVLTYAQKYNKKIMIKYISL